MPEPRPVRRLDRQLTLLTLIVQERQPRAALAARFGVSKRAIQRDVTALRRAGVRIARSREGYYLAGCPVCGVATH